VIVPLILVFVMLASAAEGQSLDEYLALLNSYADDADQAVDRLATAPWRPEALDRNVKACMPAKSFGGDASPCNPRLRALSAALHAEAAGRLIDDNRGAAAHLEMARRIANVVRDRPAFTEKWYEFVTMQRLSDGDARSALELSLEAGGRLPGSPIAPFLRGVVHEVSAMFDFRNLRDPLPIADRLSQRIRVAMAAAGREYGRALALDPAFLRARLRLGWTQLIRDDPNAEASLTAAAAASDRATRYLARLFLGSWASRKGDHGRALTLFEAAREEGPAFQSACLASSHARQMLADQRRSEEVAGSCLTLTGEDPWWRFRVGAHDAALLRELRIEAARP
jgi:hypothetical protein